MALKVLGLLKKISGSVNFTDPLLWVVFVAWRMPTASTNGNILLKSGLNLIVGNHLFLEDVCACLR